MFEHGAVREAVEVGDMMGRLVRVLLYVIAWLLSGMAGAGCVGVVTLNLKQSVEVKWNVDPPPEQEEVE